MPQDGYLDPQDDLSGSAQQFDASLTQQQPQGRQAPPMLSEQATSKFYDPITAGLIHDTPSPDEVFRAIRSTPVINPLAIMRGQQIGPEMLPSTILKAQRMSAVKERAQLLALLQDTQAHQMMGARIQNQQERLAFEMMRQQAAQGNAAVGAVYKTFADISEKMDPDRANAWLGEIMKQDVSQGIPNEAAGRAIALKALMDVGGIKAKTKATNAPAGFQFTPEGDLQGIPGGPADPNVIRQNAEARHITVNVGGGGMGRPPMGYRFAPGGDLEAIPGGPADPTTKQAQMGARTPPLGQAQIKDLTAIDQQNSTVEGAISDIQSHRDAYGGASSVILGAAKKLGAAAGSVAERNLYNPQQIQARSSLFNQISAVIKERAGTAQTKQELERINAFLPSEYDDPDQILAKLYGFKSYLAEKRGGIMPYQPGTTSPMGQEMPGIAAPSPQIAPPPGPVMRQPPPGYYPTPGPNAPPGVMGPAAKQQKILRFNPSTGRVE